MSGLTSGRKVFSGRWSVCLPFGGLPGLECLSVDKKKRLGCADAGLLCTRLLCFRCVRRFELQTAETLTMIPLLAKTLII